MNDTSRKSIEAMLPRERRSVAIIAIIAMLRMFGLFALLPVLALYASTLDGVTPALIGIAVGGYGLTQAALQIPFGSLSDRIGRRPVILIGLGIFAAGSILAGLSDSIYGVIAGRLLQGAGAVSATLTALLADSTRPEVRTRSMAFLGIGIGSAFLLALILGPVIAALLGAKALFWQAAIIAGIAAILLFQVPRPESKTARVARRRTRNAFRPDLLRIDAYVFLLHAIMTALFVALPFAMQNVLGLTLADHWKMYVGALLVSLAGTIPLVIADERKGKSSVVLIAIFLLIASQAGLALLEPGLLAMFVSLVLFFAGFNFLEAGLPARLSIMANEDIRGAAMGVFSSSQFLGAFAGGLGGGILMASGDGRPVFIACAVAAIAWLVLHVAAEKRT